MRFFKNNFIIERFILKANALISCSHFSLFVILSLHCEWLRFIKFSFFCCCCRILNFHVKNNNHIINQSLWIIKTKQTFNLKHCNILKRVFFVCECDCKCVLVCVLFSSIFFIHFSFCNVQGSKMKATGNKIATDSAYRRYSNVFFFFCFIWWKKKIWTKIDKNI